MRKTAVCLVCLLLLSVSLSASLEYMRFQLGEPFFTNTYVIWDSETKVAAIIDPAIPEESVAQMIELKGLDVRYLLLTHMHGDHIGGLPWFKERFPDAVIAIHEKGAEVLMDPGSYFTWEAEEMEETSLYPAEKLLHDGDEIELGKCTLTVIHTPGHTTCSICYLCGDKLFAGDTLFHGSIGRTWSEEDGETIRKSITEQLFTLPDDLVVFPGHGRATLIGWEKVHNRWLGSEFVE